MFQNENAVGFYFCLSYHKGMKAKKDINLDHLIGETPVTSSFKQQDDDGDYFCCECPFCKETVEYVPDDFKWKNGRYEMTWFCEECESPDFIIERKD